LVLSPLGELVNEWPDLRDPAGKFQRNWNYHECIDRLNLRSTEH
jgi:hypothetical protein